jgi:uncharacterized protein (DUF1697 family)
MARYLVLLRGINVGGKNKVPMAELRACLEELGHEDVQTYIASGNVLLTSRKRPKALAEEIEDALPKAFALDTDLVRVHVLTHAQLRAIVAGAPKGFGAEPETYHSDAIFLIGVTAEKAIEVFDPREGVDAVWPGDGVVYSQRLSAKRTKSRLSKIAADPLYKQMTIRSWTTTTKLLALMDAVSEEKS